MHILGGLAPPPNRWLRKLTYQGQQAIKDQYTSQVVIVVLGGLTYSCTNESKKKIKVCLPVYKGWGHCSSDHTLPSSIRVLSSRRHLLYVTTPNPQVLACVYMCIPGGNSTKWLKVVERGTGNLHNRNGNKTVHSKSSICCEFCVFMYKITGLFASSIKL